MIMIQLIKLTLINTYMQRDFCLNLGFRLLVNDGFIWPYKRIFLKF